MKPAYTRATGLRRGRRGLLRVLLMGLGLVLAVATTLAVAWPPVAVVAQTNQLFQGDLTVEAGQVIPGDAVVYDGDVHVDGGGRINGNLVVFDGEVSIEAGGIVEGDVDLFSGDATVEGAIRGNLALWAGDVTLTSSANVEGDINVLAGDIERAPEARVGGRILEGPNLNLNPPQIPVPFEFGFESGPQSGPAGAPANTVTGMSRFVQWTVALLARLLGALLFTGFVAVLMGLAVHVRPDAVQTVRRRIVDRSATVFVVGLAANLMLVLLGGLLALTICLLPIALVPMLALLAINLLGWAALAQLVGQRLEAYTLRKMEDWVWAAMGAVLLTGGFALLWAFGGFFRGLGNVMLLFTSSFGAGAVLYPWIMRALKPSEHAVEASAPNASGAGVAPAATAVTSSGVVPPAVAGEAEPIPAGQASRSTADAPAEGAGPAATATTLAPAPSVAELEAAGELPPDDLNQSTENESTENKSDEDDFTQIKGIGPVLDGRLKEAGIRTYGQLAELAPAEIAEILGWSETRVQNSEVIEQARAAAAN